MSEQYVSLAELNQLLEKENERRGETGAELNAIQKSAMEHAQKAGVLSKEDTDALIEELKGVKIKSSDGEYPIPDELIYKIADILPKYKNDVRAIFYKVRGVNVEENKLDEEIIEIVSKYI